MMNSLVALFCAFALTSLSPAQAPQPEPYRY